MTEIELKQAEKTLIQKEKHYSELMRKSFEISLNDRSAAAQLHDKATHLYEEIVDTRIALDMEQD